MGASLVCGRVTVSDSVAVEPSFAVPASLPSDDDSLTRRVPSSRQNTSASSVSTRLHEGQRFILLDILHPFRPRQSLSEFRSDRVLCLRQVSWLSDLWWELHAPQQLGKARVRAQRIEQRLGLEIDYPTGTIVVSFV